MMNKKADNQWYGKGFEQAIVMIKNNLPCNNPYPDKLSNDNWDNIVNDAKTFIPQYEKYKIINSIEWIGDKTKNENGDLIINGNKVEIKHVSGGTGTYLNTSWETCVHRYKMPLEVKQYLTNNKLYDELILKFKNKVNTQTNSPFTINQAKEIINSETEWYNKYKKKEEQARIDLVSNVYNYLNENPDIQEKFIYDIVTKNISDKQMPDELVIYNYNKKEITYFFDNKSLMQLNKNFKLTKSNRQKLGFTLGNFRIQIGWQNGAGLCNPTIRAFIK